MFVERRSQLKAYELAVKNLESFFPGFSALYSTLADEPSRDLLLRLICYRLLGEEKVKLPYHVSDLPEQIRDVERKVCSTETIVAPFVDSKTVTLSRCDLQTIGYPVSLFFSPEGVYTEFVFQQYAYREGDVCIEPQLGDVALDCGACWGDTSLWLACKVGETGQVFSFEFNEANLAIFHKNLEMNQTLNQRVKVINKPVTEKPAQVLSFVENGPGSRVSLQTASGGASITGVSIDEFFQNEGLGRIDYIKMDIEGAELPALKGAVNILRRCRPKLAITIYHSLEDFVGIPAFLKSLDLGYRFFLKHASMHLEETVLFAMPEEER